MTVEQRCVAPNLRLILNDLSPSPVTEESLARHACIYLANTFLFNTIYCLYYYYMLVVLWHSVICFYLHTYCILWVCKNYSSQCSGYYYMWKNLGTAFFARYELNIYTDRLPWSFFPVSYIIKFTAMLTGLLQASVCQYLPIFLIPSVFITVICWQYISVFWTDIAINVIK